MAITTMGQKRNALIIRDLNGRILSVIDDESVRKLTKKASKVALDRYIDRYDNRNNNININTELDIDEKVDDEEMEDHKTIEITNINNLYEITNSDTPRRRKRAEI